MDYLLALQSACYAKHLDLENGFPNDRLDWPFFAGLLNYYYKKTKLSKYVFKLNRSLYGLKYATLIRNQTLFTYLCAVGLTEMVSTPCIFLKKGLVMIYYVVDLFFFRIKNALLDQFETELSEKSNVKNLGCHKQALGIELG